MSAPEPPQPPAPPTPILDHAREGRIKVDAAIIHGAPDGWFLPGNGKAEWFKDNGYAPEMVVVAAGEFMMGSPGNEPEREPRERPLHKVKFASPLASAATALRAANSAPS